MTDKIEVRELADADLPETLELLRLSLGETSVLRRTRDLFAWKHWDNPFGRSIALVATSAGRIVGLRTFMRWRLRGHDFDIECVRPVDTATHPEFQRRGIFRDLTMHAIESARAMGIQLVFNTPNDKSKPGYLKMGWSEVGPIPIQAVVRPVRWFSSERAAPVGEVGREVDPMRLQPQERIRLHTPQSPEYLHWRFRSHPTVRYRAIEAGEGVAVLRSDERMGRAGIAISDVYGAEPGAAIRKTRKTVVVSYVVCSFPPGTSERRAAVRAGLIPVPGVRALTLVARPLDDLAVDPIDSGNWHLALSDLELL